MQTMVACVAPLGRRAHRNPLRAALGEFEFYNRKEFAKRTERVHEDKVQTRAIADFKDAEDYNNAKENMKRAIEKVDTSWCPGCEGNESYEISAQATWR